MSEYKKPKNLKLKKIDTSVVKPKKGVDMETKMSMPKGLKIRKAPVSMPVKKKKQGKITRTKSKGKAIKGTGSPKGYRRLDLEPTTEAGARQMMKDAMEKARYRKEMELKKKIKNLK